LNRYVCIHGHFYQPPRENPWLEELELQDSAYPYHDWNQRITAECYAPNIASRILDRDRQIINIVNNYAKISFNFGPTLLNWLAKHQPDVHDAIVEADLESQKKFSGHGNALAQVYNHLIMPLANSRDKQTQIIWGIKDFQSRFKRQPEGLWLAETAVDLETLELLATYEIKFTILAPNQAKRVRKLGGKSWRDVSGAQIDPKMPYQVNLPSGKTIAVFFYDGPISQNIAFGGLLNNGEEFANRLLGAFVQQPDDAQLVQIATDGETYGHHHRYGEMALSYCLYHLENKRLATLTNYAEYLEKYPPTFEAEIYENSSWSCAHGIERWRSDCGCNSGLNCNWRQQWRGPLREAMNWLRDELIKIYEPHMKMLVGDPWKIRDEYIEIILDRSEEKLRQFLSRQAGRELSWPEQVKARQLLEMERNSLLMFTSCGWFFDDISGIETIQVMLYAARAMQLAKEISGYDLEQEYIKRIEAAQGNVVGLGNGAIIYQKYVQPETLDLLRVGAHYAISSLFEDYAVNTKLFSFWADQQMFERLVNQEQTLSIGRSHIFSVITAEECDVDFAVLHLGGEEIVGGVRRRVEGDDFQSLRQSIKEAFKREDYHTVISYLDRYFGRFRFSLLHLFKDEQRKILSQVAAPGLRQVKASLRQIFDQHQATMRSMNKLRMPLPMALYTTARFVFNDSLRTILEAEDFDLGSFRALVNEVADWPLKLDKKTLSYYAGKVVNRLMARTFAFPENIDWLRKVLLSLKTFQDFPLCFELDLWQAQNFYFKVGKKLYNEMRRRADQGLAEAKEWLELFDSLGDSLQVRSSRND
jgi:alpha-amylase/alpha-mannosidase (GH57 family)